MKARISAWWFGISKTKRYVIAAAAVLIAGFGIFSRSGTGPATDVVVRGDIRDTVRVSGHIASNGQTAVYSTSTGIVSAVFAANGDTVTKGQKLFSVVSTASDAEKQRAYAAYLAASDAGNTAEANKPLLQSQLESARKSVIDASSAVDTMNTRRSTGSVNPATGSPYTQNEIDSIQSALTSARSTFASLEKKFLGADTAVAAAKSSVSSAWSAYQATQDSTMVAPASGTVANISVVAGDRVTATAVEQGAVSKPVLLIADLSRVRLSVRINEKDISRIRPGQTAEVTLDAVPGASYSGTVDRVDDIGTNTNGVVTYSAYVIVNELDPRIKTGMTADAVITVDQKSDAVLVPNTALVRKGDAVIVRKKSGAAFEDTSVTVGIKDDRYTEVTGGLTESDIVEIPY